MLVKVTTVLAVVLGVALGRVAPARAQCSSWSCSGSNQEWSVSTSPGRVIVNTTNSSWRNAGLRYDYNGSAQWSIALVGSGASTNSLQFYNDSTSILALQVGYTGQMLSRDVVPLASNTHDLGTSDKTWGTLYVETVDQSSDGRLKKDVRALGYGLDHVLKLRPVTFKWLKGADDTTHIGLIAQEVERVIPEVVTRGADAAQSMSIAYSDLIPVLIKAVQVQETTIGSDGARIARLEEQRRRLASDTTSPGALGAGLLALLPGVGLVALLRRRRRTTGR